MSDHWDRYHRHWNLLGPPLRLTPATVAIYAREAAGPETDILLLGMTPDLRDLGRTLHAIDGSQGMIDGLWPGDTPTRWASLGSWFELPAAGASADAVIGDGSLNSVPGAAERLAVLGEAARVLRPGGRAAFRIFSSPEEREDLAMVREEAFSGRIDGFHAFKWKVAMAIAGPDPDRKLPVPEIRDAIDAMLPDRAALSAATGWPPEVIGTIDAYDGSDAVYSFATLAQAVEEADRFFDEVRVVQSGDYPLAERCPLIVMERARRKGG